MSPSESWAWYNDYNRIVFTNVFICYGAYLSNNVAASAPAPNNGPGPIQGPFEVAEKKGSLGLPYIHLTSPRPRLLWVRFGFHSGQDNLGSPGQRPLRDFCWPKD